MTNINLTPSAKHLPLPGGSTTLFSPQWWQGDLNTVTFDRAAIKAKLLNLEAPCYLVKSEQSLGVTHAESDGGGGDRPLPRFPCLAAVLPISPCQLGDPGFCSHHSVQLAYAAGAMAGGIASEEMVITLGRHQLLGSFGTGGLAIERIEAAIHRIQQALPLGPYAFNLLHNPHDQAAERQVVDLFLQRQVRTVEASAFLDLTPNLVYYRVAGLNQRGSHPVEVRNKVIAKLSRREVATKFLQPAPVKILRELINQGLITEQQARLAEQVPMADDITVEADSGGHTDNRPLVCLLPDIQELRDEQQAVYRYPSPVRIGVAGGIGTPQSVLAAFMMGAAYVVTGSINQSCIEAGTSDHTRQLLAAAEMHDMMMAPAADMFEMGVKLQVLKRGTLFPLRAQKLFELYKTYDSIEAIPAQERQKIETQIFKRSLDAVWQETQTYLAQRKPEKLARALQTPKLKMASIFRWYLGLSSRWAIQGKPDRKMDYQIWCGPAMGAFNNWVRGSYLEEPQNRRVAEVAIHLMTGSAFLYRLQVLKMQGIQLPTSYYSYHPLPLVSEPETVLTTRS
ncbi:MAG: PfaD family polyunsaturated fatty acid/polyketide biosynthesis protein [Elainellaceae cyanobacterium]